VSTIASACPAAQRSSALHVQSAAARSCSLLLVAASLRLSAQDEFHGDRHPHGDRLPTPTGRLEAPASYGLGRCLIEICMSSGLLDLDLFYTPPLSDIRLDDDGAFDTLASG
jgi:hypothetical protein